MPEYIDKDALYKDFLLLESCQRELAEEKEVDEYTFIKRQQALEAAMCYRQFVDNFPAADVAPVVHGKWVLDAKNHAYCSQCLYGRNIETQIGWNYCPNCGSKNI